jgi:putative membrane protein
MRKEANQEFIPSEREGPDPAAWLAVERTQLALERTHLAWIRTVITLMVSGFTIDKVVEVFHQERLQEGKALLRNGHVTGLVLISSAALLLFMETVYYIRRSGELARMRSRGVGLFSPGTILSILIFLAGIVLIYLISDT